MSYSRRHDLREAVGNLLIVTMYLPDALSRFHRPGLHAVDLRVTRRVRRFAPLRLTNPRAAGLSEQSTFVPSEHVHNLVHWSLVAIPSQAPPTSAISSVSPELRQTMFCLLENAFSGHHVPPTEP